MMDTQRGGFSFWSADGPLASLACTGLLVVSSGRLAYALVTGTALVFVYLCSLLTLWAARPLVSARIRGAVSVIFSSFFATVYFFILSLLSPLLAEECSFFLALCPIVFVASGLADRSARDSLSETAGRATLESASILALIVGFALIRESLGYGSLSLPFREGLVSVIGSGEDSPFIVHSVSSTIGGLILTAYAVFAFRKFRARETDEGAEREDA